MAALLHGAIEELELRENQEVDHTLWVPLRLFIITDHHTHLSGSWRGSPHLASYFDFTRVLGRDQPCIVWGLTAAICAAMSSIALDEPTHYPSYFQVIEKIDDKNAHMTELAPTSPLLKTLSKL